MQEQRIAFIGGGNMAASLVGGILNGGFDRAHLRIAEPDPGRQQELIQRLRVGVTGDNVAAASDAGVVVLAVKPQVIPVVCRQLSGSLAAHKPLVISIAAGVREPDIRRWLGYEAAIVRAMPNTPALLGCGATGIYANPVVSESQRSLAESVMRAVGMTRWVDNEPLMDAVTAVSGSGPAYFFLLMEMMAEAGKTMGLDADTARLLVIETAFGAAKMALESPEAPADLRARVTSPGGTTERAVQHLESGGMRNLMHSALEAARSRAEELGEALGQTA